MTSFLIQKIPRNPQHIIRANKGLLEKIYKISIEKSIVSCIPEKEINKTIISSK